MRAAVGACHFAVPRCWLRLAARGAFYELSLDFCFSLAFVDVGSEEESPSAVFSQLVAVDGEQHSLSQMDFDRVLWKEHL